MSPWQAAAEESSWGSNKKEKKKASDEMTPAEKRVRAARVRASQAPRPASAPYSPWLYPLRQALAQKKKEAAAAAMAAIAAVLAAP